jgi:hypothetical protein
VFVSFAVFVQPVRPDPREKANSLHGASPLFSTVGRCAYWALHWLRLRALLGCAPAHFLLLSAEADGGAMTVDG